MQFIASGQGKYSVRKIEFSGNEIIDEKLLWQQMNTAEESIKERLVFWKNDPFYSPVIFNDDLERVQSFYKRQGFLHTKVDHEITKNEKKGFLKIKIVIEEGDFVKINSVMVTEAEGAKKTNIYKKALSNLPLKQGERFIDRNVFRSVEILKQAYQNKGYPLVEVDWDIDFVDGKEKVDVHVTIYPDKKYYFGQAMIEGNSLVKENFIRKQIEFEKGDVYSAEKINETQQQIFNTELFNYAIIRAEKDSIQGDQIPVTVKVEELEQWNLKGGVGYGTEDRFRFWLQIKKINFFGGSRKIIFEGKHSYFLPVKTELRFVQPSAIIEGLHFVFNPFYIHEREQSFEVKRYGSLLTLQRQLFENLNAYLNYNLQKVTLDNTSGQEITDVDFEKPYNKSGFTFGLKYSSVEKMFNPEDGWSFDGYITLMGIGFNSKYHYQKTLLNFRKYERVFPGWVVAGKLKGGYIKPAVSGENTPLEERYFAGGAISLRGWGRHTISPENDGGFKTGGNSLFESSLEVRFPIYKIIRGTVFMDAGNVWDGVLEYHLDDLRYNTGMGLRIHTPVGPVRLDLAKPVFEQNHKLQFYISLGHAF